jgi:hypothetical protein
MVVPRGLSVEEFEKLYPRPWVVVNRTSGFNDGLVTCYFMVRPLSPNTDWLDPAVIQWASDPRILLLVEVRLIEKRFKDVWQVRVGVGRGMVREESYLRPGFPLSEVVQREGSDPDSVLAEALEELCGQTAQIRNRIEDILVELDN